LFRGKTFVRVRQILKRVRRCHHRLAIWQVSSRHIEMLRVNELITRGRKTDNEPFCGLAKRLMKGLSQWLLEIETPCTAPHKLFPQMR
jgi:hypothetical protein